MGLPVVPLPAQCRATPDHCFQGSSPCCQRLPDVPEFAQLGTGWGAWWQKKRPKTAQAVGAIDPSPLGWHWQAPAARTREFLKKQGAFIDDQRHHLHEQFKQLRLGIWEKKLGVLKDWPACGRTWRRHPGIGYWCGMPPTVGGF